MKKKKKNKKKSSTSSVNILNVKYMYVRAYICVCVWKRCVWCLFTNKNEIKLEKKVYKNSPSGRDTSRIKLE